MRLFSIICLALYFIGALAHASDAPNLLANGDFAQGMVGWTLDGQERAPYSIVPVEGQSFKRALRIEVNPKAGEQPEAIRLWAQPGIVFQRRQLCRVSAWVRSSQPTSVIIRIYTLAVPSQSLNKTCYLTKQWQQISLLTSYSNPEFWPGKMYAYAFDLAAKPATIEFADVRLAENDIPIIDARRDMGRQAAPLQPDLNLQVGHRDLVSCIDVFPDNKRMVSASFDGTLKIWDIYNQTLLRTIRAGERVFRVKVSPDGTLLAVVNEDNPVVSIYQASTGYLVKRLTGHTKTAKDVVFARRSPHLISASADSTIRVWNLANDTTEKVLTGHIGEVTSLALSRDDNLLVSGGTDQMVRLWNWPNEKLLRTIQNAAPIYDVDISSDGLVVAAGALNGFALFYTETGVRKQIFKFKPDLPDPLRHREGRICFSPDGSKLLFSSMANALVYLVDATTYKLLCKKEKPGAGQTIDAEFSADGSSVFSMVKNAIMQWNGSTYEDIAYFGTKEPQPHVFPSPSGDHCALFIGKDSNVWNMKSGALETKLYGGRPAFHPSGKVLLVPGQSEGSGLVLQDLVTGQASQAFWETGKAYARAAISGDGALLALCDGGSVIEVCDYAARRRLRELTGHVNAVCALAFSPVAPLLASADTTGAVILWNAVTGEKLWTASDVTTGALSFSQDGQHLICLGLDEEGVIVRNATTGDIEGNQRGGGSWAGVATVGNLVAGVGYFGERILIMRLPNTEPWTAVTIPKGSATGGAFASGDKRFITAGQDGAMRVYEMPSWRLLATMFILPSTEENIVPEWITVTPEGYYNCSPQAARFMDFNLAAEQYPAECFAVKYYRPDMVERALKGEKLPPIEQLKGAFPPQLRLATNDTKSMDGVATVTLNVVDDSAVQNVAFFVNGARVEATLTQNTEAEKRPLTAESRPLTADSRDAITEERALMADSRPLTADSRPLTADSRPLTADSRTMPVKVARNMTFRVPVPTDISARVQVLAFDDDGLQSPRQELLFTPGAKMPDAAVNGRLLGLCVGVSTYRTPKLNLKFADKDAQELAAALNAQKGLYRTTNVDALTNERATLNGVTEALDALVAQATRSDTVMLLLAGHGWRGAEDKAQRRSFYFATHELDAENIAATALPWSDVVSRLGKLSAKSRRVIVLLDACHSGSAAGNEDLVKEILNANAGVMVLASSRGSEVSLESAQWAHGAFTKAILEAIQGKAAGEDKGVSIWDFANYVKKRVAGLTENQQHPQVPFLSDFDTDASIVTVDGAPLTIKASTAMIEKPGIKQPTPPDTNKVPVTQPTVKAELQLTTAEIRLEGMVRALNVTKRIITLDVQSFTLPAGKTSKLISTKVKTVYVIPNALIHLLGDATKLLTLKDVKIGQKITLVGADLGSGQMLPAREVAVSK